RYKVEEARKRREASVGKTEAEVEARNREDALNARIAQLARKIHIEWFPEEYDHMYDSIVDAKERARGGNPMSSEYIGRVAKKRAERGVEPLSDAGMSVSDDSWTISYSEAEARVRSQTV